MHLCFISSCKAWKCLLGCGTSIWHCIWKYWGFECCRVEVQWYHQFPYLRCSMQKDRHFGREKGTWFCTNVDAHQSLVSFQGIKYDERRGVLFFGFFFFYDSYSLPKVLSLRYIFCRSSTVGAIVDTWVLMCFFLNGTV